jgi:hypothetical protein
MPNGYPLLERHVWAWIVGGLFSLLSTVISFVFMRKHQIYNNNPNVKTWILLVLLMVPVYAVTAWLGLFQKNATIYWDVLRESYEALAIFAFYRFLYMYLKTHPDGDRLEKGMSQLVRRLSFSSLTVA